MWLIGLSSLCSLARSILAWEVGADYFYRFDIYYPISLLKLMSWPRFRPQMASEVRSDLIRSPILGGPKQLLFYATFWLEAILTLFWPFFTFGHKMGTPFGHAHKKLTPANFGPDLPGSLAVYKRQASKQTERQIYEYIRLTLWPPPLKMRIPCKIWEGSVQRCGRVSRTHTHTQIHTHTFDVSI